MLQISGGSFCVIMTAQLTVGIPAYNEERTIESTIDSFLRQELPQGIELDILVCANHCTDRTERVVQAMQERYPEIRVISTDVRGKSNAWNMIREEAGSEIIVYSDADIRAEPDAVRRLYEGLQRDQHIQLLGANVVMVIKDSQGLMRVINPLLAKVPARSTLNGRLYAIRRGAVIEIPPNILNDDEFLSLSIMTESRGSFQIDKKAIAYYSPPLTLSDYVKYRTRCELGSFQIRKEHPELDFHLSGTFRGREGVFSKLSVVEQLSLPFLAGLYIYCKAVSRWQYTTRSDIHEYSPLISTKKTV